MHIFSTVLLLTLFCKLNGKIFKSSLNWDLVHFIFNVVYWYSWIYVHHFMFSYSVNYVFACLFSNFILFLIPFLHYYFKVIPSILFRLLFFITYMLINLDSEKLCIFTLLTSKYTVTNSIHPSLTYMLLLTYILISFLKAHETWLLLYANHCLFKFTKLFTTFWAFHSFLYFRLFIQESLSSCLEYLLQNFL